MLWIPWVVLGSVLGVDDWTGANGTMTFLPFWWSFFLEYIRSSLPSSVRTMGSISPPFEDLGMFGRIGLGSLISFPLVISFLHKNSFSDVELVIDVVIE